MYKDINNSWNQFYQSVCSITYFKNGDRLSSGTGFRVGEYIVTNAHVTEVPNADRVRLRFVEQDGFTTFWEKDYTVSQFESLILDGQEKYSWDYVVLDIDCDEVKSIPSLSLASSDNLKIGSAICLLGFQFEQQNLSIHSGIISSLYEKAKVDYIQIDAAINQGNSGGPLIDINTNTGNVIGIVTRKATGLTELFDKVIQSFDQNIQYLNQYNNVMNINGFNPVNPLIWSQGQMKILSKEIKRSANVGIGYAYKVRKIRESIEHLQSTL